MRLFSNFSVVVGLFLIAIVIFFNWGSAIPRQSQLIEQYQKNKESYSALKEMIREDGLVTIGDYGSQFAREEFNWTDASKANVSETRAAEYKKIMLKTDTKRVDLGKDGTVTISMAGWGFMSRGWRINLVWLADAKPSPMLSSIDEFERESENVKLAYSHIENNWYLNIIQ
jgi:hypothetical protein